MNKKKTEVVLEHIKQSNDELRKNINIKQAIKYNKFMNYIKIKSIQNKKYNEILNKKMELAKDKYTIDTKKKLKQVKTSLFNDEIKHKAINFENTNKNLIINKEKIKEIIEKNKEKIIEKENKYFLKAKNKEDKINERKNNALMTEQNTIKINEIKFNMAKEIYERIYKNDVIYKKEKL